MPRPDWTPHRRDDGELLGWIHPAGDDWVAVDVLGRPASAPTEWLDAEVALEEHGIAWLADPWMLEGQSEDDRPLRVRILEVTPDEEGVPGRIVVKIDDFGDMSRPATAQFIVEWPIPDRLRAPRADDPDPRTISR
ncbi:MULTISPECIES: hypothetical protein [unclassified Microbacterium]|jgi:hypothetical protein|uniref:hypothetical protein n=1 Tax=unclassified Microbacterium TaxID=2609290 RepID=UPI000CFC672F|nr:MULTISPECIES: hypothetical protein [unclassified Microbacterium]PQZ54802.1 hypothetical protein CQ032_12850 [Microbacterium sp. MYb43]PQZ77508.1 hypothetical protein CQ031_11350 [Microbacterium sp. MYb40]PRB19776.1 hypothetical protein CQ040_14290 [Microbacterium sp. MYb54]PRB25853.1 hypothetical protein CQ037_14030 [Microbacterium sp. MYb50]PRB64347.1 hypothetical protein CQ021_14460 [Microbacterium sp. MYb24]